MVYYTEGTPLHTNTTEHVSYCILVPCTSFMCSYLYRNKHIEKQHDFHILYTTVWFIRSYSTQMITNGYLFFSLQSLMYTHTYTHTHTCAHTHTSMYTHTHTQTNKHTHSTLIKSVCKKLSLQLKSYHYYELTLVHPLLFPMRVNSISEQS